MREAGEQIKTMNRGAITAISLVGGPLPLVVGALLDLADGKPGEAALSLIPAGGRAGTGRKRRRRPHPPRIDRQQGVVHLGLATSKALVSQGLRATTGLVNRSRQATAGIVRRVKGLVSRTAPGGNNLKTGPQWKGSPVYKDSLPWTSYTSKGR